MLSLAALVFHSMCGVYVVLTWGFLFDDSTCQNRCDQRYDPSLSCQCNTQCQHYNNCCQDYSTLCHPQGTKAPSCLTWAQVGQALWDGDTNRLTSSQLTTSVQAMVSDGTTSDHAGQRFFTSVDASSLTSKTFQAYLALLDNYDPVKGQLEVDTAQEKAEVEGFLDAVLETKVMAVLLNYLKCQGTVSVTSQADLKQVLHRLWFEPYPRSGSAVDADTSGFEHMIGEYKTTGKVNGFHSWLSFYLKEKTGTLNYLGMVAKAQPNLVSPAFSWNGRMKTKGTFFVGVSPEFDLAVYSLCFLVHPDGACQLTMQAHQVAVRTYGKDGHIASAFVS